MRDKGTSLCLHAEVPIFSTSTILEVMCFFPRDICTIQVIRSYHSCHQIICIIQVIRSYASFKSLDHMHHSSHQYDLIHHQSIESRHILHYNMISGHMSWYTIQYKYDLAQFLTRSCASKSYVKYISTILIFFNTSSNCMHQYTVKSSWISYSRTHA